MVTRRELTRAELYEKVWSQPMHKLCKEFQLSDKGLAKKCIKHKIPRPALGYWAKVDSGQHPKKTPLPRIKDPNLETVSFTIRDEDSEEDQLSTDFEVDPKILDKARKFKVPTTINKYHHLIREARKNKFHMLDQYGRVEFTRFAPDIGIKVTPHTYTRACHLLETLVRLAESIGWQFKESETRYSRHDGVAVITDGISELHIEIKEPVKQIDHVPDSDGDKWFTKKFDYLPAKTLHLSILGPSRNFKTKWRDTETSLIEDHLVEIVESFAKGFEYSRLLEIEREAERLEWERKEKLRQEQRRLEKVEEQRRALLLSMAEKHDQAESIRQLTEALAIYKEDNKELEDWLSWSQGVAEMLDPVSDVDAILRSHNELASDITPPDHFW